MKERGKDEVRLIEAFQNTKTCFGDRLGSLDCVAISPDTLA